MMNIFKRISELSERNSPFVIATVIKSEGSVPGKVGFKMLVETNGDTLGTVGGGAIEQEAKEEAISLLSSGENVIREYMLSDKATIAAENTKVLPMSCSGRVSIFFEVFGEKTTVYLFGGGHVGNSLLQFLKPLGYHTILIDNRKEFAGAGKNPDASERVFSDYIEYAKTFNPNPGCYFVAMTHGHQYDFEIVKTLLERKIDAKYIGVIASKTKAAGIISKLRNEFGDNIDLSRLHTPIGLKIGGNSAIEIALSISAQIQAVKYGKL